jgi:hypothetical protein
VDRGPYDNPETRHDVLPNIMSDFDGESKVEAAISQHNMPIEELDIVDVENAKKEQVVGLKLARDGHVCLFLPCCASIACGWLCIDINTTLADRIDTAALG